MNVSRKVFINKQRFRNALQIKKVTVQDLAQRAGISYDTLRYCVLHESIMPDTLETICKYLDVSPLYIQGKQTEKAPDPDQPEEMNEYYSGFADDDIPEIRRDIIKRTDSDGNRIPHYWEKDKEQHIENKQKEKDMIIDLLVSNFSNRSSFKYLEQYPRSYFEKHFDEIAERIEDAVIAFLIRHED